MPIWGCGEGSGGMACLYVSHKEKNGFVCSLFVLFAFALKGGGVIISLCALSLVSALCAVVLVMLFYSLSVSFRVWGRSALAVWLKVSISLC